MKSRVYLNSAFLLRAAIGFSRHPTSAREDSYSYYFNLYSIVCRISCTYFHLIRGFQFFSQKTSASMSLLLPVSSKNEGNLEGRGCWTLIRLPCRAIIRYVKAYGYGQLQKPSNDKLAACAG